MSSDFHDWLACPDCDEPTQISILAYKTELVFQCYECGRISEFVIGEDTPLRGLDPGAVTDQTTRQTGN